ncbi:MAG: apolipoprotein N-acyltransferase [Deinococcales bacterium]
MAGFIVGWLHLPLALWWLAVLPLAALLYLVAREPTAKSAFRVGFFGWLGFWSVHLFWLPQSFSASFGWFVWFLMPLLWVIEAFFNASVIYLAHRLTKSKMETLVTTAMFLVLLEYIRASMGVLAFPWGNFGYLFIDTPIAQIANLGGVYLLSVLFMFLAIGVAALGFFEWRILPAALLLLLVSTVYGLTRPSVAAATRPALLVQGNIGSLQRLAGLDRQNDFETYMKLSKPKVKNSVIVFPEAALGLEQIAKVEGGNSNVPKLGRLIAGVADFRRGSRSNSVAAIKDGVLLAISTKQHLVPFGEFYPLRRELAFVYDAIARLLGFGFGSMELRYETRTLELDGERFGTYVCYDSVFPDVPKDRVLDGAQVLVNVSNDSWFGRTWGIEQHFMMGRMRAIETGRYVLRAGNTGITAVIDSQGRVVNRAPIQQPLALEVQYGLENTRTLYVRFGDWAVGLALLVAMVAIWLSRTNTAAW